MARYVFNAGFPVILGSRGGATFQRCGRVFAIRKRAVPVQKNSPKQSAMYSALSSQSTLWRSLSPAQKGTFTTFQADYPRVDSLGNTYLVEPVALMNSMNMNRLKIGAAQANSLTGAIAYVPITINTWGIDRAATAFTLWMNANPVQASCRLSIFVGLFDQAQRPFSKRDCVFLGKLNAGANTSDTDWWNAWKALFPAYPISGVWWVPVFMEVIQLSSGQVIGTFQDWAILEN
jgi:hypothetical protein